MDIDLAKPDPHNHISQFLEINLPCSLTLALSLFIFIATCYVFSFYILYIYIYNVGVYSTGSVFLVDF